MQRLDSYPLAPGCCALCRGNAAPLIDTGINTDDLPVEYAVEQSGWVYVCVQCVFHMAALLGGAGTEETRTLRERVRYLEGENARLSSALAAADTAIRSMTNAGYTPADPEVANV